MLDKVLVNIYNEGQVPWLRIRGPVFGYSLTYGVYDIIQHDPAIRIELTTPEKAQIAKAQYLERIRKKNEEKEQKSNGMAEQFNVVNEVKIEAAPVVETVNDDNDDAIDAILENTPEEEAPDIVVKPQVKKYRQATLEKMTKQELKQILRERGYEKGPYAAKYHDKVEDLIQKVLKTQKL